MWLSCYVNKAADTHACELLYGSSYIASSELEPAHFPSLCIPIVIMPLARQVHFHCKIAWVRLWFPVLDAILYLKRWGFFIASLLNRHPKCIERPSFQDIVRQLSLPDTKLLKWTEEDKSVHPEAAQLGADLLCGEGLYKDLQSTYHGNEQTELYSTVASFSYIDFFIALLAHLHADNTFTS